VSEYEAPGDLHYSKDDEWVRKEDGVFVVGVTDYAQQQLGDVVFVELPEVGAEFAAGDSFGTIESVKAVSDLFCPIAGRVTAVNGDLEDAPETVNQQPYGSAWIIKLEATGDDPLAELLDADGYQAFCADRD
jgi:glycine cleavage system H protein